jgi:hypothetical protein
MDEKISENIERLLDEREVKLLDGSTKTIYLFKDLNLYEVKRMLKRIMPTTKVEGKAISGAFDMDLGDAFICISECIWSKKNTIPLADICASELIPIVVDKLDFLVGTMDTKAEKTL